MRESGKLTCSTVKAKRSGLMARATKAYTRAELSMVVACISGQMEVALRETGIRIRLQVKASMFGLMVVSTSANG